MKTPNPTPNCSSFKLSAVLCLSLLIGCLTLSPKALALDPPPDGGYPNRNTAEGEDALFRHTTGGDNVAVGYHALYNGTTGFQNTAIGSEALYNNSYPFNTGIGWRALYRNTTGQSNTAIAPTALYDNTVGDYNCAIGYGALGHNIDGSHNIATGQWALYRNTSGRSNAATGFQALFSNTIGELNTATGNWALLYNTGDNNTGVGVGALFYNETGNNNIALGMGAGYYLSTGDNNIDIGNAGVAGDSNTIRIGAQGTQTATYVAGIFDATASGGTPVYITSDGQLGTSSSSGRFKKGIKPMDKVSEAILALEPVTFEYKNDSKGTPQFGLVAEDVAKVNPDLVMRDRNGEIFTVRYDAVNAMVLNEFLKEHRKVEQQEQKLARQETAIAQLQSAVTKQEATAAEQRKEIAALTAGLQKVSAQVETSRPTTNVAVNQQ
jgi:uncharacterized coiled-coil protein SlyX